MKLSEKISLGLWVSCSLWAGRYLYLLFKAVNDTPTRSNPIPLTPMPINYILAL